MKKLLVLFTAIAFALTASATEPFNLSLTPELSIQGPSATIEGLTLSIWGENEQQSLALGFVNGTKGDSAGLSWGLINYGNDYTGVQLGFLNLYDGDVNGWQHGAVNYTGGDFYGLQTGWINYAGNLRGLQLGLVNYAVATKAAVQVGIANIIVDNPSFFTDLPEELAPAMIFVNWSF